MALLEMNLGKRRAWQLHSWNRPTWRWQSWNRHKWHGRALNSGSALACNSLEGSQGVGLLIFDVEQLVQPGDCEDFVDLWTDIA